MADRERSIHEMLKDAPSLNDSCGAVHTGTEGGSLVLGSASSHSIAGGGGHGAPGGPFGAPNSLPLRNHSGESLSHYFWPTCQLTHYTY